MADAKNSISPKVTAATVAAALATILVWIADETIALEVPAAVEGAFVVILTLIAGYWVRDPLREEGAIGRHAAGPAPARPEDDVDETPPPPGYEPRRRG